MAAAAVPYSLVKPSTQRGYGGLRDSKNKSTVCPVCDTKPTFNTLSCNRTACKKTIEELYDFYPEQIAELDNYNLTSRSVRTAAHGHTEYDTHVSDCIKVRPAVGLCFPGAPARRAAD